MLEKTQETRLVVDWYGPKGLTHHGDDPWFLRIRSYSGGKYEVTWKAKSNILGTTRKHKEINFLIEEPKKLLIYLVPELENMPIKKKTEYPFLLRIGNLI